VRLDVDDHAVARRLFKDVAVDAFHHLQRFVIGKAGGLVHVVSRVDVVATRQVGPADGIFDVGFAQGRGRGQRQGKGRVQLGKADAIAIHLLAQRQRIFPEGDVGLVAQAVNPAHAVDRPALNVVNVVTLRPLKALLKAPVRAVKCVRVKADLDHLGPLVQWSVVSGQ